MNRSIPVRMAILGVIAISLFAALFVRLGYLQVFEGGTLAAAARTNQVRTVYEAAPRGRILDRAGNVLAGNRETDVITVTRDAVSKDHFLLDRLAAFLGTDRQSLQRKVDDPRNSPYRPVPMANGVDKAVIAAFRERRSDFEGATAETQVQRWYPEGTLAAHILGYVGEITQSELDEHKSNYRLGDQIGKVGLEEAYEKELRGTPGTDKIEVDSSGRAVRVLDHTAPVPGRDIKLSLAVNVQRAAEQALSDGLAAARESGAGLPAEGGAVVAVDPQDGGVLASASYPTFDPGSFAGGISNDEYAKLTDPNGTQPLTNRPIQGQYAPGSTFKPFTALAGLKSGVITPATRVNDTGSFFLGGRRYQNAQGAVYGSVDLPSALTVSSDVYFYTLGSRIWDARGRVGDVIQGTARDYGFGAKSGYPLSGETDGRIPDPASRKKLHEQAPQAYPEGDWFAGDNVNLAIGQGDTLVTPLQLADAYAAIGNGGRLWTPSFGVIVLDPSGKALSAPQPHLRRRIDVPTDSRQAIENGMVGAVQNPKGTAYGAFKGFDLGSFPVAGKTGTAQVAGKRDSALFAGYGPVGAPRVAVSVVLEQGGFGGTAAAPVGRRVIAAVAGQSVQSVGLGTGID